jgi:hypothetical protein
MKSFKNFLAEAISPSRKRLLDKKSKEGRWKLRYEKYHKMTDEQKDQGVQEVFGDYISKMPANQGIDKNIVRSNLPHHHAQLLNMAITHFESGLDKKKEGLDFHHFDTFAEGRRRLAIAKHVVKKHLGEPYANMLANNDTREILKRLAHG